MAGIVFLRTADLARTLRFYTREVGMEPWLSQPGIEILRHGNLLLGFQEQTDALPNTDALLTFFYPARTQVDEMYDRFAAVALDPPRENTTYRIYNFFARDPDGRRIEFQCFLHPLPCVPAVDFAGDTADTPPSQG